MFRPFNIWWFSIAGILGLRFISMTWIPLTDTSEPRYAEIARLMLQTGDWITPWFEPNVPFWGKPPLAFWCVALSMKLLGINEFAARFPAWLATLATLILIFRFAKSIFDHRTAQLSVLIFSTSTLAYVAAGAVLTDPFLMLGTTLSMTGFIMAAQTPSLFWRYGFFIGLAIGLLAKGPLAPVLTAGPILLWLLINNNARHYLKALPWWRGSALTLALSVPWYVAAEIKTPGFLQYFIVGEHFLRFVDPGWTGDLYGNAHERVKGTIWAYWLMASFPWGILGFSIIAYALTQRRKYAAFLAILLSKEMTYLGVWSLFTALFFTLAGNILWTYILPSLPALSILVAIILQKGATPLVSSMSRLSLAVPVLVLLFAGLAITQPDQIKSEKSLVAYMHDHFQKNDQLFFLDKRPFSARFYSHGLAQLIQRDQLPAVLNSNENRVYLAVPIEKLEAVADGLPRPLQTLFENRRFALLLLDARNTLASAPTRFHEKPKEGRNNT